MRSLLLALALVSLPLVACSSSDGDAPLRFAKTCLKTQCESQQELDGTYCSQCTSACIDASYDCDLSTACSHACSSTKCTDAQQTECEEEGFKITSEPPPNAGVEAACNRMFDHLDACQLELEDVTRSACATVAKLENDSAAKVYDCIAAQSCSADFTPCSPTPSTAGDEIAAAHTAKCPGAQHTPDEIKTIDASAAYYNDAMLAAGRACVTDNACDDIGDCLEAWRSAD